MAAHNTIVLAIRNLISILPDRRPARIAQTNGVPKRTSHYGAETGSKASQDYQVLPNQLFGESIEDIDELGEPFGAFGIAFGHALRDALLDMKAEDREADPVQGGFRGGELLEDVDTEAGFLHHPPDTPDLALNPVEARHESLLLRVVQHAVLLWLAGRVWRALP
jgi:hypothetical protein